RARDPASAACQIDDPTADARIIVRKSRSGRRRGRPHTQSPRRLELTDILPRSTQSNIWIDIGIEVQHLVVCWTRSGRRVGSSTGAVQMSHANQLIEIATEFAMDAKDDVADLRRKLTAIETAKVEIEARLHIANHALERLSSFVSVRGSD